MNDTWQNNYEAAERLQRSILAEIGDRGRAPRSSVAYNQSTQRLRSMYSELTSSVTLLRSSLSNLAPQLTTHELNRRRDLLENLAMKVSSARESIQEGESGGINAARSQLLADLGTTSWGSSTPRYQGESHLPQDTSRRTIPNRIGVRETERSVGVETGVVRSEQDRLLAEQEAGLDMLGNIISRQKGMSQNIFNEVTEQNNLIDDIDDRVENVNQRLLDTTGNIRIVDKKDRTCGYWIVILILAIAIVVVLFA